MSIIYCSKEKPFNCAVNGVYLTDGELHRLSRFYEVSCTADYLMETYHIVDGEEALKLGCEVRELMLEEDISEEEAIERIIKKEV